MTSLALDFTAMMSAAAAQHLGELAAKDAQLAEFAAQLDKYMTRAERLAAANETLKTRVAALESLVSERAVAAEQRAYDDLAGSVLAEEAAAAAAAQAEEVLDLTGEDEAAPAVAPAAQGGGGAAAAPAAAAKPKRKAALGTLAWMAYVKHVKATQPEALLGAAKECEKLTIIKGIRAMDPEGYVAFVAAWMEEQKDEASSPEDAPAAQGGGAAAAPAAPKADHRTVAKLAAVLPEGTPLSLTGTGDRWDGAYTKGGLIFQDKAFKSPLAVTKVWSERITERHPKVTRPGSGWVWLKIENGAYKGKTLAQAYDAHYSA